MRKHRAKRQIFIPYNGKIADITHADTNKHFLDLETALTETRKIIGIMGCAVRVAGTGDFWVYANEGTTQAVYGTTQYNRGLMVIADGTQRLQYSLTVANDDFDFFCYGYVVEV